MAADFRSGGDGLPTHLARYGVGRDRSVWLGFIAHWTHLDQPEGLRKNTLRERREPYSYSISHPRTVGDDRATPGNLPV